MDMGFASRCHLKIPFPSWAKDAKVEGGDRDFENWKEMQRWADDFYTTCLPSGAATITIAASNASTKARALCDYVCDGVDDQEQFHLAFVDILALGGGRILLSEGTFACSAGIVDVPFYGRGAANVTLQGQGRGATIIASTFSTSDSVLVSEGDNYHLCDLTFDGTGVTGTSAYGVEIFGLSSSVRRVGFVNVGWRTGGHILYMANDNGRATVEGCSFVGGTNGVEGLRLGGDDSMAIGNYFLNTPTVGINCDSMDRQVVANNVLRDVQHDAGPDTTAIIIGNFSIASGNTVRGYVAPATIIKGTGSVDANNVLA